MFPAISGEARVPEPQAGMMEGMKVRLFGRRTDAERSADSSAGFLQAERAVVQRPAPVAVLTIDALGRKCPIPIIMLAEQIGGIPLGAVVAVLADDPAAYTDIPSWCAMKSQEFVHCQELTRGWALFIRRQVLSRPTPP